MTPLPRLAFSVLLYFVCNDHAKIVNSMNEQRSPD